MRPRLNPHPATVPPDYPRDYERDLRLSDGRQAFVRPILPEDSDLLASAIRTADPETLYRRFLGSPPSITPVVLDRLCTMDYRKRMALVAADALTGDGVGIARYETTADATAEIAVAVDPAWRRIGLATALVELLAEAALDRGIVTFSAYYLAQNRPVTALLDLLGNGGRHTIRQGFAEAAVALDRADVAAAVRRLTPGADAARVTGRQGSGSLRNTEPEDPRPAPTADAAHRRGRRGTPGPGDTVSG